MSSAVETSIVYFRSLDYARDDTAGKYAQNSTAGHCARDDTAGHHARDDTAGHHARDALLSVALPNAVSFRPERSGVEKSICRCLDYARHDTRRIHYAQQDTAGHCARNSTAGHCARDALLSVALPNAVSFRPERSGVEKSICRCLDYARHDTRRIHYAQQDTAGHCARNSTAGHCARDALLSVALPNAVSFRPERSGVEKSKSFHSNQSEDTYSLLAKSILFGFILLINSSFLALDQRFNCFSLAIAWVTSL